MLSENIKNLRKAKGLSQEALAAKLHVVRQTISKWEKGLSVPDSEMLVRLAEVLDCSVATLLGESSLPQEEPELAELAARLEEVNAQLARQNERRRKFWRSVFIILGAISLLSLIFSAYFWLQRISLPNSIGIIGGADGPTAVFVAARPHGPIGLLFAALVLSLSVFGIFKTKRR